MEGESSDLDDGQLEKPGLRPLPLSLHPHFPFIVIEQFLGQEPPAHIRVLGRESSALVRLWRLRPERRARLAARWCSMAETRAWAWDECEALLKHLDWMEEEVPEPLRPFTRLARPRHQGRKKLLARDLQVKELVDSLMVDGSTEMEAKLTIALYLAENPADGGLTRALLSRAPSASSLRRPVCR